MNTVQIRIRSTLTLIRSYERIVEWTSFLVIIK